MEKLYRLELTFNQIDALDDLLEVLDTFSPDDCHGIDLESLNEIQIMVHSKQNKIMEEHVGEEVGSDIKGL
jgi:hypothetical protein